MQLEIPLGIQEERKPFLTFARHLHPRGDSAGNTVGNTSVTHDRINPNVLNVCIRIKNIYNIHHLLAIFNHT